MRRYVDLWWFIKNLVMLGDHVTHDVGGSWVISPNMSGGIMDYIQKAP